MISFARRYRKAFTISLLLLSMSGGRVYALSDTCDRTRVFFGPSLGFKMVAKSVGLAAAHATWQRPAPRSLGERGPRFSADDLLGVRFSGGSVPIAIIAGSVITLAALPRRAPPQTQLALSCDVGPTPPLHSRK